jgi:hypothetical protein
MDLTRIYVLQDPHGVIRYVGKTNTALSRRLSGHLSAARLPERKTHVAAWIRSLLNRGMLPTIHLVQEISGPAWAGAEAYWISYFRSNGSPLTNLTNGGEGAPGYVQSPESIAKRSARLLGRPRSLETRQKLSIAARQRPNNLLGLPRTEEWKLAIGKSNGGSANGMAKLTEVQVEQIKIRILLGASSPVIAQEFGISARTINLIKTNQRWAKVPWPSMDLS